MSTRVFKESTTYTESTNKTEKYQAAYREHHSTETALLRVKADLLAAMDKQEVTCLVLLDLSAAFDTISHHLLLNHLKFCFGITDMALQWVGTYLSGRTLQVMVNDETLEPAKLHKGVPQGSVLGPILFTLYMSPIGDICQKHNISFQSYADNQQNYLLFKPMRQTDTPRTQCIQKIQECIAEIRLWMHTNLLKLNNGKTEVLVVGTRQQLETAGPVTIAIGEDLIEPVYSVCNLGYHMDSELKDKIHINKLTASSMGILKTSPESGTYFIWIVPKP